MDGTTSALARLRAVLLLVLGGALVALPTLGAGVPEGPAAVTVTVLGLVLAALLPGAGGGVRRTPLLGTATPATAYDAWPTLRARVLDPVHPVRPRAPGVA